jgi:alpha-tubulin suppressor-like RCC1 family protein
VLEDGSVICFGRNLSGAVGDDSEASFVPVPAHVATGAIATAAGGDFSLAVTDAKGLLAWGGNDDGQLGLGDLGDGTERRAPILTPIDDWRAVAAGGAHACGIATTGQLRCWGSSELGQTGLGTTVPTPAPTAVGTAEWSDVSAGNAHSCGVQTGATLWCWGSNARSQLGLGRGGITQTRGEPTSVSAAAGWTQVAAGSDHTCALQAPGVLWCWGDNGAGQLGTGDTATRTLPWFIEGTVWREVTAGGRHSCGVFGDGLILCWGDNASGQLGTGDRMPAPRPARVSGRGGPWTTVSAGRAHTCAVDEAGAVYCWGAGADGRLGLGDEDDRVAPTRVCLGLE